MTSHFSRVRVTASLLTRPKKFGHTKFAKEGFKNSQILNKPTKVAKNFEFRQSGKISQVAQVSFLIEVTKRTKHRGAAIAQLIPYNYSSCGPGFESQTHHQHFFNL